MHSICLAKMQYMLTSQLLCNQSSLQMFFNFYKLNQDALPIALE